MSTLLTGLNPGSVWLRLESHLFEHIFVSIVLNSQHIHSFS